jgi:hypothetical protein
VAPFDVLARHDFPAPRVSTYVARRNHRFVQPSKSPPPDTNVRRSGSLLGERRCEIILMLSHPTEIFMTHDPFGPLLASPVGALLTAGAATFLLVVNEIVIRRCARRTLACLGARQPLAAAILTEMSATQTRGPLPPAPSLNRG